MKEPIELKMIRSTDPGLLELLSDLLSATVNDGASIGFLPPMESHTALRYWQSVPAPGVVLLTAWVSDRLAGSVQLHLCTKENGLHRAEVCKLMVHPAFRRRGIARALMHAIHGIARDNGRTLLVLDTREGDPANALYLSLGYTAAGTIPGYARSADGRLDATVLYYRLLG